MKVPHQTMELLIAQRLEDMAERCAYHLANGDIDLAELLREEGLALAQAYDDETVILVAEALF